MTEKEAAAELLEKEIQLTVNMSGGNPELYRTALLIRRLRDYVDANFKEMEEKLRWVETPEASWE